MKILWLINFQISMFGNENMVKEGWITGMLSSLSDRGKDSIFVLYPQDSIKHTVKSTNQNLTGIGYYRNWASVKYNRELKKVFASVLKEVRPDVIHVMGTEYPHTFSMCEACEETNMVNKLVISIQGLVSQYAKVYQNSLPLWVIYGYLLRDIKHGNVHDGRKGFLKRGKYESAAIKKTVNIIGRTEWDWMSVKMINPAIKYYHNNEVLRNSFYNHFWNYISCSKATIFISQGDYPIKGIQVAVKAVGILKEMGYDVKLRIAGYNILENPSWKRSMYFNYINGLINKYNLQKNIMFLGPLKEEQMLAEYLNANIYVSPSIIENSPNSLGEAMILGMPVISSDVGGVKNFVQHGINGYIFPTDEPYMLGYYIIQFLEYPLKAINMGKEAKRTANLLYNKEKNSSDLQKIYEEIVHSDE